MDATSRVPNVPVKQFKRVKIIATIGPATNSYDSVLELIKAGANGIRLNFSHGDYPDREQQIKWVRKAGAEYGKPVAIIADLQGPKIRLGDFEGFINVRKGQNLVFKYNADYEATGIIPLQYDLSKKVKRGERMYIFDGKVHTTITSVADGAVHARAENDGILLKRKGLNLPDTDFEGDVITTKDKKDLAFCSTQDIDYVAQSFVQTEDDVKKLRGIMRGLGMNAKIIVKFETRSAVEHMEAIMKETNVLMIARGDLAVETMPEEVPIIQRQLIGLGIRYAKPTIVATQMLFSMTEEAEATRAEISDIATAVILGADCVMLSDETASGRYPIEAVRTMKSTILYTQAHNPIDKVVYPFKPDETRQNAVSSAIIDLARKLDATAIVAETASGATALNLAARRPERPVIAVTADKRVANQLSLVYGTKSYVRPADKYAATKLTNWLQQNKVLKKGDVIVTASGQYPGVVGTTDTIKVRVLS